MIVTLLFAAANIGRAEPAKVDDPLGILKKPIPERLVVLTFDDGCASHATVAVPILKKYGFGGTFYVSDAYLFRERKDWYMTWRQIRTMSEQGFEIGNHTRGHGQLSMTDVGGCQAYVWTLEDEMIANRIPRSTTFCWPFYDKNPKFYPLLQSWGFTFARGGYGRTYDPTQDNPFDVPSFAAGGVGQTIEGLISAVQQATDGKVVVITFHGTPDMEHAGVGIDPDIFEDLVECLKDNKYKVIAMRDLVEYIDPAKAAPLPPTKTPLRTKLEKPEAPLLVKGDNKPFVPSNRPRKGYQFPKELTGAWTVKEIYRLKLPDAVSNSNFRVNSNSDVWNRSLFAVHHSSLKFQPSSAPLSPRPPLSPFPVPPMTPPAKSKFLSKRRPAFGSSSHVKGGTPRSTDRRGRLSSAPSRPRHSQPREQAVCCCRW